MNSNAAARFLLPLSLAMLCAAPVAAQTKAPPSTKPFLIIETGKGFDQLQQAVDAIGEGRGTIRIASGLYTQCAVQSAGEVAYVAAEAGGAIFDAKLCEEQAALILRGTAARLDGLVFQNIHPIAEVVPLEPAEDPSEAAAIPAKLGESDLEQPVEEAAIALDALAEEDTPVAEVTSVAEDARAEEITVAPDAPAEETAPAAEVAPLPLPAKPAHAVSAILHERGNLSIVNSLFRASSAMLRSAALPEAIISIRHVSVTDPAPCAKSCAPIIEIKEAARLRLIANHLVGSGVSASVVNIDAVDNRLEDAEGRNPAAPLLALPLGAVGKISDNSFHLHRRQRSPDAPLIAIAATAPQHPSRGLLIEGNDVSFASGEEGEEAAALFVANHSGEVVMVGENDLPLGVIAYQRPTPKAKN